MGVESIKEEEKGAEKARQKNTEKKGEKGNFRMTAFHFGRESRVRERAKTSRNGREIEDGQNMGKCKSIGIDVSLCPGKVRPSPERENGAVEGRGKQGRQKGKDGRRTDQRRNEI